MALPTIVAETSRFPTTSRCSSCHPTRQSSIQRKTSGMKSARNSSRTMPSSPSMPYAESSSRRSSISSAIPKPLNPSPHSPTSSGHSDVELVLDLQNRYDWVFDVIEYPSVNRLIEVFEVEIVQPAEAKFDELTRRTKQLRVKNI